MNQWTILVHMHKYFTRIEYDTVNNNYILSSFITYLHDCNNSNKTCVTSETGTAYHSGAPEFIRGFWWGLCCSIFRFLYLCVSFCPFLLAIVLSIILRFTASDYPFSILKLLYIKFKRLFNGKVKQKVIPNKLQYYFRGNYLCFGFSWTSLNNTNWLIVV